MFKFVDSAGAQHEVILTAEELFEGPKAAKLSPQAYINQKYADADLTYGSAFNQFKASLGIANARGENVFGLQSPTMASLMDGTSGFNANVQQNTAPFGSASRAFTVISLIDSIESAVAKDRTTDADTFYGMVGTELSVTSGHFEQPVVDYGTVGGPETAKAQRMSQGAAPSRIAFFKTADRIRRIGAWTIGMEWTEQALRATTLDYVTMTMSRYLQVERDERAYRYISDLFTGNGDLVVGAVPAVTTTSLDSAATGGVLTHKAWVKWLARNRKYRKITHAIMDLDTYLKVEGRNGRPGSNNYDPTLTRIDPQAGIVNNTFGADVKIFLVESASEGGPVPANTIYGVDASSAITLVKDTSATYASVQDYAMRRTQAMRMDWSEEVFRTFGDTDLRLFDALTIL